MKRILTFVAFAALVAHGAFAQPRDLTIQPAEGGRLELKVYKTGVYSGKVHVFSLPEYSASLRYDPARPEASRIELKMNAAALKLEDKWLNEKDFKEVQRYALEDMLEAKKHPEIRFVSSEVRAVDATHFDVQGQLFIRGTGKPVLVKVVLEAGPGDELKFTGTSTFKMTAWGLKPPKALLGLIGTKDEMEFSFQLSAKQ